MLNFPDPLSAQQKESGTLAATGKGILVVWFWMLVGTWLAHSPHAHPPEAEIIEFTVVLKGTLLTEWPMGPLPNHQSSKWLMFLPLPTTYLVALVRIFLLPKIAFQTTEDLFFFFQLCGLILILYLALTTFTQSALSAFITFHPSLAFKAWLTSYVFLKPKRPCLLGLQTHRQLTRWTFFLS